MSTKYIDLLHDEHMYTSEFIYGNPDVPTAVTFAKWLDAREPETTPLFTTCKKNGESYWCYGKDIIRLSRFISYVFGLVLDAVDVMIDSTVKAIRRFFGMKSTFTGVFAGHEDEAEALRNIGRMAISGADGLSHGGITFKGASDASSDLSSKLDTRLSVEDAQRHWELSNGIPYLDMDLGDGALIVGADFSVPTMNFDEAWNDAYYPPLNDTIRAEFADQISLLEINPFNIANKEEDENAPKF